MPSPGFTAALVAAKNALYTGEWAWLFELQLTATTAHHVTTHTSSISYLGKTWSPFPITISPIEVSSNGDLPSFSVEIDHASREVAYAVESGNLLGKAAKVYLIRVTGSLDLAWSGRFMVSSVRLSADKATLNLDLPNLMEASAPAQRYLRTRCRKAYGQTLCGFIVDRPYNTPSEFPDFDAATCDFGLDTPNGCSAHGAAEQASGYDVRHPRRFGGCPGIPKAPPRL